jgi:cyclopropane fatty-acyl-phospholipid synthase-like methyltransferase
MSESQYDELYTVPPTPMGAMANHTWAVDPKRLGFTLARYKFVAKVLKSCSAVLEIGCGDAWATSLVADSVDLVVAIDFDKRFVRAATKRDRIVVIHHDILAGPMYVPDRVPQPFDAAYALDVIEHIPTDYEGDFMKHVCHSIGKGGTLIIGTPSKESQPYASELSRQGHVNCKTEDELRALMRRFFTNVFVFGMNDETLHTGFGPMCHYRLAIGTGPKM